MDTKPWYKKWWGVVVAILFFPYFFTWYAWAKSNWHIAIKVTISIFAILFTLLLITPTSEDDVLKEPANQNQPSSSSSQTSTSSTATSEVSTSSSESTTSTSTTTEKQAIDKLVIIEEDLREDVSSVVIDGYLAEEITQAEALEVINHYLDKYSSVQNKLTLLIYKSKSDRDAAIAFAQSGGQDGRSVDPILEGTRRGESNLTFTFKGELILY